MYPRLAVVAMGPVLPCDRPSLVLSAWLGFSLTVPGTCQTRGALAPTGSCVGAVGLKSQGRLQGERDGSFAK